MPGQTIHVLREFTSLIALVELLVSFGVSEYLISTAISTLIPFLSKPSRFLQQRQIEFYKNIHYNKKVSGLSSVLNKNLPMMLLKQGWPQCGLVGVSASIGVQVVIRARQNTWPDDDLA